MSKRTTVKELEEQIGYIRGEFYESKLDYYTKVRIEKLISIIDKFREFMICSLYIIIGLLATFVIFSGTFHIIDLFGGIVPDGLPHATYTIIGLLLMCSINRAISFFKDMWK